MNKKNVLKILKDILMKINQLMQYKLFLKNGAHNKNPPKNLISLFMKMMIIPIQKIKIMKRPNNKNNNNKKKLKKPNNKFKLKIKRMILLLNL